jgi:uncharacterized membrane protein
MNEFDQPREPLPQPEREAAQPVPPIPEAPSPYYVPDQDERTFAILSHALQMPGWWLAPLIILLVKKESKFVRFHAAQVLLLQALHFAMVVTVMVIFFATIFASVSRGGTSMSTEPPAAIFLFMPFAWLIMFGMYVLIFVFTILYSIKAGKGEWAEYPVLGKLAKYMLNM